MVTQLFKIIKKYYLLFLHKKNWRKKNIHNFTIAINCFPINKVTVGKYSYGDIKIISYGESNEGLRIGNFVSIANGVQFLLGGNHFMNRFTNYPFKAKFLNPPELDTWSKGQIIVEDDVWIGTEAFIMPGITICKGAVIAARSVVTKNVEAYTIVGGNPAKFIKRRFDADIVETIRQIDFENIDPYQIAQNANDYEKRY